MARPKPSADTTKREAKHMQKMLPSTTEIRTSEFRNPTYFVPIPVDAAPEDLLRPGYWGHVAGKLHLGSEVVARRVDLAWRAELLVIETGPGIVVMSMLSEPWRNPAHKDEKPTAENTETPLETPDNYVVNHTPKTGWRVWTRVPSVEVSRNHKSKHDAITAAIVHAAKAQGLAA
jgi:hypothetical protein